MVVTDPTHRPEDNAARVNVRTYVQYGTSLGVFNMLLEARQETIIL